MSEMRIEWPRDKSEVKQVEKLDIAGKTWFIGDKVLYIPNHAFALSPNDPESHRDCEHGIITSMRDNGGIWVRYNHQHTTQPGQKTPVDNLRLL